jgi:iron complex outermembrane receptor protein
MPTTRSGGVAFLLPDYARASRNRWGLPALLPRIDEESIVNKLRVSISAFAAAPLLLQSMAARADLEEIIVTATKREQSVQDVPLTISAFDASQYRELSRGTLDGLAAQITNLQAYATNTFLQSVHIRGIGLNEFQGQYDSPVAQHIDEVYISKPWMNARRQYDIERVEVLKGPQGTLFGRNTTGGAVNYYTAPPSADFDANVELGFDEHERYRVTGMINGGLTERLSGRISFNTEFGDGGPQHNLYTGEDHGKPDVYDIRGQLLWEGDALKVRALVHGGADKSEKVAWKGPGIFNFGAPGYCPQALTGETLTNPSVCSKFAGFATLGGHPEAEFEPDDAFTINQNTPPKVDDTFYGGYLRLEYNMGWGQLTSITGAEYYERIHREDSQSDIFNSTSTHYYDEINQFTQEIRLNGDAGDRVRYTVGAFYQHDDVDQVDGSDLSEQPLPGVTPPGIDQFFAQFNQKAESAAAFANLEFKATDTVTLNAGVRYTHDKTEVSDVLLGLGILPQTGKEKFVTPCIITTYGPGAPTGSEACPDPNGMAPPLNDDRTDTNTSWMAGVEWKPTADVLVYGTYTTGYRAGGYSLPFAGAATTFDPEKIESQEIGVKSRMLDGNVQLNAAVFHYLYDDVQVNVDDPVSPLVPITRNIGEQENWGAEADLEWAPTEHWYIKQGLGWLDAEYQNTDRTIATYGGPIPLEGKTPVNSPELTYNGIVQFRHDVMSGWKGMLGVDYRWVDERYLEATNQPFDKVDDYWLANVRASVKSPDGRWDLALYCTNVFDEEYITYINNIAFFQLEILGEPRTFGGIISYNFR